MKPKFFPTLFILGLLAHLSCHNGHSGRDSTTPVSPIPNTPPATQSVSEKEYFKGGGNEPGWSALIYSRSDKTFRAEIIYAYGKEKYLVPINRMSAADLPDIEFFSGEIGDKESKKMMSLQVEKKLCTDAAERQHQAHILFKIAENTHQGCGDYLP